MYNIYSYVYVYTCIRMLYSINCMMNTSWYNIPNTDSIKIAIYKSEQAELDAKIRDLHNINN